MTLRHNTLVVVTDGSTHSQPTEQTAMDLALKRGSRVSLVDTVQGPSLFSRLLSNYQELLDDVVLEKQKRLEEIATRFREAGIETDTSVRVGKSSDEILFVVQEKNADLVIRYMKGPKSKRKHALGATAITLSRTCPCPLLLVGNRPLKSPTVLACINCEHDDSENGPILDETCKLSGDHGTALALYCWKFYGSDFLKEYVNQETLEAYEKEAEDNYQSLYERFLKNHDLSRFEEVCLEHGDPVDNIPSVCRDRSVDVVVMCHQSHHWLHSSTFEAVLEDLRCAVLVVKPESA